jgi:hypothetical protein
MERSVGVSGISKVEVLASRVNCKVLIMLGGG